MTLNGKKFEHLHFSASNMNKENSVYLNDNGYLISNKEIVKDLGVIMSSDGTFDKHISNVKNKAKDMSGWILRTFSSRDKNTMLTLWKSMVIPIFDYCSPLWSPTKVGLIQEIESIQKSFVNKIAGVRNLSYWEQLKFLKIYSLERRRERFQVLYIWSIIEGKVPNFSHSENNKVVGGINWYNHIRHGRKCMIPTLSRSKNQRLVTKSFRWRGPRLFNALPKSLRNMTGCKDKFKKSLDEFLQKVPDEPQVPGYTIMRSTDSNSLVDMINHMHWTQRVG